MLSLKLFDLLNILGKRIRKTPTPFGGIQVIFSGDFYQLPPVGDRDDQDTSRFCFESEEWNNVFPDQIQLKHNFRQSEESYCEILKQVREGRIKRKISRTTFELCGAGVRPRPRHHQALSDQESSREHQQQTHDCTDRRGARIQNDTTHRRQSRLHRPGNRI